MISETKTIMIARLFHSTHNAPWPYLVAAL